MNPELKAALASLARVFLAAALAAAVASKTTISDLLALNGDAWHTVLAAGVSAVVLTVINALRSGETRFGVGHHDVTFEPEDGALDG